MRIYAPVPPAVPRLRDKLIAGGANALEADLRFPYRYLVDKGLRAAVEIVGEPEASDPALLRFRDPELVPGSAHPALRVLSLDLETLPDASRILSVALVGAGADEVHVLLPRRSRARRCTRTRRRSSPVRRRVRARPRRPDRLERGRLRPRGPERRARALGSRAPARPRPGTGHAPPRPLLTRTSRAEIQGRIVLDGPGLRATRSSGSRLHVSRPSRRLCSARATDIAAPAGPRRRDSCASTATIRPEAFAPTTAGRGAGAAHPRRTGVLRLAVRRALLTGLPLDRVGGASPPSTSLPARAAPAGPVRRAECRHPARGRRADRRWRRDRAASRVFTERVAVVRFQEPVPEPDAHLQPRSTAHRRHLRRGSWSRTPRATLRASRASCPRS